jgi:calcineurin-like phosphoesterase family protein
MIFVISDIHGMLDTLKNLIWKIEDKYKNDEEIEEFIFLGDYIDYGPNSKEVVDYIISLPYKKTLLAGNHEDLLLQFFHENVRNETFSESHWLRDNEGGRTIRSFTGFLDYNLTPENAAEKIGREYMDFFENLLYIHEREINGQKYLFTHAHAGKRMLDRFLACERYDTFHKCLRENDIYLYNTPIWMRKDCEFRDLDEEFGKIRDYVVIHGHTPVAGMDKTPEYVKKYKAPYIEAKRAVAAKEVKMAEYIGEESIFEFDIKIGEIYGINIDTGLSVGHGLSALGIKTNDRPKYYRRDDETAGKVEYTVVQALSDRMNKMDAGMRYYKYRIME